MMHANEMLLLLVFAFMQKCSSYTGPMELKTLMHLMLLDIIIRSFVCNTKRPVKQSIKQQVCPNFQMKCTDKMYPPI